MEMSESVKIFNEETSEVENQLITASSALIAGSAILLSLNKTTSNLVQYLAVGSTGLFAITLCLFLWNKHRRAFRKKIFDEQFKGRLDELKKDLEMWKQSIESSVKAKTDAIHRLHPETKEMKWENVLKKIEEIFPDPMMMRTADLLAEHFINEVASAKKTTLEKFQNGHTRPLKKMADYVASNFRYHLFVVALLTFLASLIINSIV